MIPPSPALAGSAALGSLLASTQSVERVNDPKNLQSFQPVDRPKQPADRRPHLTFLTPPITRPPVAMLGVPFDQVTAADCLGWIESAIASRRPHYIVTANVDFLVQARFDVELRRILLDAHLVLCDGTPLVWASKVLGNPLTERVAGADVVPALIQIAAKKGYRLFFLGATGDACARAVQTLTAAYPELVIAGHYSPPFNKLLEMDHEEITARIRKAKPDLLFVCFGCPKQEKWMTMHYRSLGVPVSIGLGATIDFLAGQVRRAPIWMRQMGLEWTFRLAQEPRRLFRRYMKDLCVFGCTITAQWWRLQFRSAGRNQPRPFRSLASGSSWHRYKLPACVDAETVSANLKALDSMVQDSRHCLLDVSDVKFIDSTGIGSLARLQQQLWSSGRQLVLLSPTRAVRRALRLVRLQEFVACACDVATALQIIESRTREQASAVTRRTAAAVNPLTWHGEITAANAESVWEFTRQHLNSLCGGWKTSSAKAQRNGNSAVPAGADTEPRPALDALKLRILTPPALPQRKLIIDLSAVRFIDSTGLGLMIRAKKLVTGQGAHLVFTGVQSTVRNVIRIARLEDHLLADPLKVARNLDKTPAPLE